MLSGGKAELVKGKNKMRAVIMTGIWKQKSSGEVLFVILKWVNNLVWTDYF